MNSISLASPQPVGDTQVAERRRHQRIDVMWMASLRSGGNYIECLVVDLSCGGARLLLSTPVALGPSVRLEIAAFGTFAASVAWQRNASAGIRFDAAPEVIATSFAGIVPL